ncbi:uncharacterized protein LOC117100326 [Anneissia japonica]|uniref:uncharacterized protein LOC117100326 n=1 Tax=Anneissia japonica TaxID=1529436 RepID=UPI001425BA42|nr:uncharacterized protein LOC117100326 [Anneissia japonica]
MATHLELEKLMVIGEKLGLKSAELKNFIESERVRLKMERDQERDERAKQREIDTQQKEAYAQFRIEEIKSLEKQLEMQLKIEELKSAQAEAQANAPAQPGNVGNAHVHKGKAPKLPPFNQDKDDVDADLNRFERYAQMQGWDKATDWATNLAALLQGNALFEYSTLSTEDAMDYDKGHYARDCRQKQTLAFLTEVVNNVIDKHIQADVKSEECVKLQPKDCPDIGAFMMIKPDPHLYQASKKGFFILDCGHKLTVLNQVTAACKHYDSSMPVTQGKIGKHMIQVLRDSGCSGVVVKTKHVEPNQMTGDFKTCILIDSTIEFGNTFKQVVVPKAYREHVLRIAHESILGGHQGSKKTRDKVMSNFTWPGMLADVTRVAVDIVGPLKPATERGHRYILVLVDYATRYPEAAPMTTIGAEAVAEELLSMYSRLGFPKEVLTDQGSQFISGIMKEVNRLLSIHSMTTTPYHAMCNGLCEKFNGILKAMLKKMCEEKPRDWDRYIDPLLFAYRETPQASTGFSPFELLYGRTVRGPMKILKELWTGETEVSETKNVYQYVLDLQERLEQTCQLAREELQKSKQKYKMYYNKKARTRDMKVGDEVLLLLPTDNNKLLMHWKGPFPIKEKKYHRRETTASMMDPNKRGVYEIVCTSVLEDKPHQEVGKYELQSFHTDKLIHLPPMVQNEHISDVKIDPRLNKTKTHQVKQILLQYKDTLTDIPGKTTLGKHVIKLTDTKPIKSKPYPIPHALREDIRKEVQSMLRMGIISHSNSPYACPLVAVKKPDGSLRACCDIRKINSITIFDAEPVPDQDEIFSQLSEDRYFSKIDLSKGYWQIPMSKESKPITAFVTHDGLYEFNMMLFGLVNSGATFSRVMRKLLKGIPNVHNYIDDILIHTKTWEDHLQKIKVVFDRLKGAKLTARPTKCFIGYEEVEFLGHIIGQGLVRPKPDKLKAIEQAERPITKTQVRSFLGLAGYYRKFIPQFADIAAPLTNCTKKGEPNVIRWDEAQDQSFQMLKGMLSRSPVLQLPDLNKEFTLRTDASDTGVGAVLLQEIAGEKFPVAYASKKLNKCQQKYSVMERECLAVVWACLLYTSRCV